MTLPHARQADQIPLIVDQEVVEQAYDADLARLRGGQSRAFSVLLLGQWVFAIVLALVVSPRTWAGATSTTNIHVYYAILLGGLLTLVPTALCVLRPHWGLTRHTFAVAQMLWSALLVHLMGGRIETHFHIFGSLAFLAFYRDPAVLLTATVVTTLDHIVRSLVWPESIYGIPDPEWWRSIEHAAWVVFEDVTLLVGIRMSLGEMRSLARRRAELESINQRFEQRVEERTSELHASREQYRALVEGTRSVPWVWQRDLRRFTYVGPQGPQLLGCGLEDWLAPEFMTDRLHPQDAEAFYEAVKKISMSDVDIEHRLLRNDGGYVTVRSIISGGDDNDTVRGFMIDVTEQRRLEGELLQAQKLESVGRLASGIAHEINTPIQFVSDSIHFIQDSFNDTLPLLSKYRSLRSAVTDDAVTEDMLEDLQEAEDDADLNYVMENLPRAIMRSIDGLDRVATLVRSMKEFAHPDQKEKTMADLNRAIETTITIARNEYKYVADLETDFGDIPSVKCHVSELNQVFLNIIVNAAHAIGDKVKGTDKRGSIKVSTSRDGEDVVIAIADNGGGIPEAIRAKIFEPFFTTKEVGRGTGQGLAISRSVVVEKHGGGLHCTSVEGEGTTFFIRLPIMSVERSRAAA